MAETTRARHETPPSESAPAGVMFLSPGVTLYGSRRSLVDLCARLDRSRFCPLVVGLEEGPLSAELKKIEVPFAPVKITCWRKVKTWPFVLGRAAQITRLALEHSIRLIHANDYYAVPWALVAARRARGAGLRVAVTGHVRAMLQPRHVAHYRLAQADAVVTVSQALKNYLAPWPEAHRKTFVVHNGIELSRWERADLRERFREQLGVRPGELLVGMVAKLYEDKDQASLLRAAARAGRAGASVRLVFCGGATKHPRYEAHLRRLARELDWEARTHFAGFVDDLRGYYEAMDVCALTSRVEGFGRVLLEGMAYSLPCVASRVGGIPEIVQDGVTGRLCPAGDEAAFAAALVELAQNAARRESWGRAGRRRVEERFSLSATVRGLEQVFAQVLAG